MTAAESPGSSKRGTAVDRDALLDRNVLESMSEGVMTVNSESRIGVFNAAAARLLGLTGVEVRGKLLVEVVLVHERLEEFSDAVLAAVNDKAVGLRSTVRLMAEDDSERFLAVTTSYLADRRNGGKSRRIGIVVVLEDITEIETLRQAERKLTEATREQNGKLRDAYREIEQKNRALDSALKKVSSARTAAVLLVALLFLGSAWYVWKSTGDSLNEEITESSTLTSEVATAPATVTVMPQPLTVTLAFVGRLAPRREVYVTSPAAGKVARVLFEYGGRVSVGQPLIELDTAEIQRLYRAQQAEYLEARDTVRELEDWRNSSDVVRLRRAVALSKLELDAARNELDETSLLLQRGIIPASEHEAAQRRYEAQQLSHEAATQDLEAVLAEADGDAIRIASLRLDNAGASLRELERILENNVVSAPASGIVLQPGGGGQDRADEVDAEPVAPGRSVSEGEYLLTIGSLDGFSVVGNVDEVDVVKLRPSQSVSVSGDAFPGLVLAGQIQHISSQSHAEGNAQGVPAFDVAAAIDDLSDEDRERLRLGMSANVVVVVRDEPAALLVPLDAVEAVDGNHWVRVRGAEDDAVHRVPVEIGATTLNEVEVVRGLRAGDKVLVSGL